MFREFCRLSTIGDSPIRKDENLVRITPVDHTVSAVPVLYVMPGRSVLVGGPVILQTCEDDAGIGRMLCDEIATKTREPHILGGELSGTARVAIEKYTPVATAPQFVWVAGAMDQYVNIGMGVLADRDRGKGAIGSVDRLDVATPDRCAPSLEAAAQIDNVGLLRVDGDSEVVIALGGRQDVWNLGHAFPVAPDPIEAIEPMQPVGRCCHQRIDEVGISRLHSERNAAGIRRKIVSRQSPGLAIRGGEDF